MSDTDSISKRILDAADAEAARLAREYDMTPRESLARLAFCNGVTFGAGLLQDMLRDSRATTEKT